MQSAGNEAERDRFIRRFLDLARAEYSCRVPEQQQPQQDFWRNWLTTYGRVMRIEYAQIQESNDFDNEARQVIGRQSSIVMVCFPDCS
jgi:hypothetical protein